MCKCKRCGRKLTSPKSIELGYGAKCYNIIQLNNQETKPKQSNIMEELLNRVRKLELDNNFMKHQLKHKFIGTSKDSELDWDIKPEVKKAINESEIKFNVVVKELKVILTGDNFNYRDVLSPINPISEPVSPPIAIEI